MSSESFYTDLPALADFTDVLHGASYRDLPDDWVLFIADVRNSTDAIRRGLYRAVNTVGASCITAALNGCPGVELPFVFGGDGATLAVPASLEAAVTRELQGVAAMAQAQFALELRVGRVPVRELRVRGFAAEVARYRIAGADCLAMLRGDGVTEAEKWIKAPGSIHLIGADRGATQPNVTGLSCRWEPLRSVHGEILTLLVQARASGAEADSYYLDCYARVRTLLGLSDDEINPVKHAVLHTRWPPGSLDIEVRSHTGSGGWWRKFIAFASTLTRSLAGAVVFSTGWAPPGFDPRRYKDSMIAHSDYRKFDGLLRMVIDAPAEKIPAILDLLESDHRRGAIFYGVHRSATALVTCVVFSLGRDSHIHFIDGNDGGYALAAVQFKRQLKAAV